MSDASLLLVAVLFAFAAGSVTVLLAAAAARRAEQRRVSVRVREILSGERRHAGPAAAGDFTRAVDELADALTDAENRTLQARAAARALLNGIREGLLAVDHGGRVVLANNRLLELFDLRQPVEGQRVSEVVRSARLLSALDGAFEGHETHARAAMMIGGQARTIEMRVFPIPAESDIAVAALFIDLTEIERLQRVRRDFLVDFHHEVRTPLAGLRLAVESLQAGPLDESQTEQLQKIITRQVLRLERLVREVGELNEIESGEIVLQKEPTDLFALVHDLAEDFRERAAAKNVAIEVAGEAVLAMVDAAKAQQIFSNLIDNALKHATGSTAVRIEVFRSECDAVVRVSDQGEGIAPEEQEKIFHRFYRVDKSRSSDVEGTGLGLAIVKHLVLRHGGNISVESAAGRGATFEVKLPLARHS